MERSLLKRILVLSIFIAIILTNVLRKSRRTLLEENSEEPYPSSENEEKENFVVTALVYVSINA